MSRNTNIQSRPSNRLAAVAVLSLVALGCLPASALAAPKEAARVEMRVQTSGSPETVYAGIERQAERVCSRSLQAYRRDVLFHRRAMAECEGNMTEAAVRAIATPELATLHQARTGAQTKLAQVAR